METMKRRGKRPEVAFELKKVGKLCSVCTPKTDSPTFRNNDLCPECQEKVRLYLKEKYASIRQHEKDEKTKGELARAAHARTVLAAMRANGTIVYGKHKVTKVGKKQIKGRVMRTETPSRYGATQEVLEIGTIQRQLMAERIEHERIIVIHAAKIKKIDKVITALKKLRF